MEEFKKKFIEYFNQKSNELYTYIVNTVVNLYFIYVFLFYTVILLILKYLFVAFKILLLIFS